MKGTTTTTRAKLALKGASKAIMIKKTRTASRRRFQEWPLARSPSTNPKVEFRTGFPHVFLAAKGKKGLV